MVALGVVPEEGEMEAILTPGAAVASSRVAAEAGKDRDDVAREVPGTLGAACDFDLDLGGTRPILGSNAGDALQERLQVSARLDGDDFGSVDRPRDSARDVFGFTRRVLALGDDLVAGGIAGE
jgi:hypothetical protein